MSELSRPAPAPANTACGFTGCASGKPAVHVLRENLPIAPAGTPLCGFHSPYDRDDTDNSPTFPAYPTDADKVAVAWYMGTNNPLSAHDVTVSCYESTSYDGGRHTEDVHELRFDGSCRCGKYQSRTARMAE